MAAPATAYLERESEVLLTDLVVAETVYVLESFYEAPRQQVAAAVRVGGDDCLLRPVIGSSPNG